METKISFAVFDTEAKEEADLSASSWSQPWAPPEQVVDGLGVVTDDPMSIPPAYASGEPGTFRLDGTMTLLPEDPTLTGWWSDIMSGDDGTFARLVTLIIRWENPRSSVGITIHFDRSTYLSDFEVKWYAGSVTLHTTTITGNNKSDIVVESPVDGYDILQINAIKTDQPFRYVKIQEIDFGETVVFNAAQLISANVLEDTGIYPSDIPAGELSFEALDTDGRFDIVDPQGIYAYLREGQELTLEAYNETGDILTGKYYLSDWSMSKGYIAKITAVDSIGKIEETAIPGPYFWDNNTVDYVMSFFLERTGIPLTIENDVSEMRISGMGSDKTYRDEVQKVCIATGAIARINRSDNGIEILKLPTEITRTWDKDDIMGDIHIAQTEYVSSLSLNGADWSITDWKEQDMADSVSINFYAGEHEMYLNPHDYIDVDGIMSDVSATLVFVPSKPKGLEIIWQYSYCDKIRIDYTSDQDYTVQMKMTWSYKALSKREYNWERSVGVSGRAGKSMKIDGEFVGPKNYTIALDAASRYVAARLAVSFTSVALPVRCGDRVKVPIDENRFIEGNVASLNYDFARDLMDVEVVG